MISNFERRAAFAGNVGRSFALEVLGIPPGLSEDEMRSHVLRRIHDDEFVPDPEAHDAVALLFGHSLPPHSSLELLWLENKRSRRQALIDEFVSTYFSQPRTERQNRWRALRKECGNDPRMVARLRQLKPGLAVETTLIHDSSELVVKLAALAGELFVLESDRRVFRRQHEVHIRLSCTTKEREDWKLAARRLHRKYPKIVRLAPDLITPLAPGPAGLLSLRSISKVLLYSIIGIAALIFVISMFKSFSKNNTDLLPTEPDVPRPILLHLSAVDPKTLKMVSESLKRALAARSKDLTDEQVMRIVRDLPDDAMNEVAVELSLSPERTTAAVINEFRARLAQYGVTFDDEVLKEVARETLPSCRRLRLKRDR